jgi:hypothetical protein
MILVGIIGYTFITCFAALPSETAIDFWFLAIMVGLFQGGIQALSRSEFGKLCPKEHANEYKYAAIRHLHRSSISIFGKPRRAAGIACRRRFMRHGSA